MLRGRDKMKTLRFFNVFPVSAKNELENGQGEVNFLTFAFWATHFNRDKVEINMSREGTGRGQRWRGIG